MVDENGNITSLKKSLIELQRDSMQIAPTKYSKKE